MLVVPEFGQSSKRFGGCCDAGLDVIVILEAVRYIGPEILEVLGVVMNPSFTFTDFVSSAIFAFSLSFDGLSTIVISV
jgi:hypothetical protein